jgi:hypothetical protein
MNDHGLQESGRGNAWKEHERAGKTNQENETAHQARILVLGVQSGANSWRRRV